MACTLTLNQCVSLALSELPPEVLSAIDATVQVASAALAVGEAARILSITNLNLRLAALNVLKQGFDKLIAQYIGNIQLIPPDQIAQCLNLGVVNLAVVQAIETELADVENILFKTNHISGSIISLQRESKNIAELQDLFACIHEAIQKAIGSS